MPHDDDTLDQQRRELERLRRENDALRAALELTQQERNESLRFLDTPAIAITYMKRDGTIVMVNDTGARNMGDEPAKLVGRTIFEIFPALAAQTRERIETTLDTGDPLPVETPLELPSGKRWFRSTYYKVPETEKRPEMVQLISQDITELKRLEEVLETTAGRLTSILEHSPFLIALIDLDGVVRYLNRAPGGYRLEQMIGVNARELMPREQGDALRVLLATIRDEAQSHVIELEDLFGRHWQVHLAPILRDGTVGQYLAFGADVSERRRAQDRQRQLEAQVQHAQKLESLGVLAGGIAHDFNNLLVGILGNAQLAERNPQPESTRARMRGIIQAAQRAADLCRQMLAYAGRGELQVAPIDLPALSLDILELLRASISKRTQIVSECSADLPPIEGDATQLRQVVMNLLTNAADSLEGRDGVITLRCGVLERTDDASDSLVHGGLGSGPHVYVEVTDTGCGMDEETRARMFDPFFTSKRLGSGLGLAAALGIIRSHHGGVEVESEPGRGTRVRVLLPAAAQVALPESTSEAPAPAVGGTILVVDDEEMVRSVISLLLEEAGHRVILAHDGVEALARYDEDPQAIDAVLMDLSMPRMDGREASRLLHERDPDLPIVLASGFAAGGCEEGGASSHTHFIAKPYDIDTLLDLLNRALSRPEG